MRPHSPAAPGRRRPPGPVRRRGRRRVPRRPRPGARPGRRVSGERLGQRAVRLALLGAGSQAGARRSSGAGAGSGGPGRRPPRRRARWPRPAPTPRSRRYRSGPARAAVRRARRRVTARSAAPRRRPGAGRPPAADREVGPRRRTGLGSAAVRPRAAPAGCPACRRPAGPPPGQRRRSRPGVAASAADRPVSSMTDSPCTRSGATESVRALSTNATASEPSRRAAKVIADADSWSSQWRSSTSTSTGPGTAAAASSDRVAAATRNRSTSASAADQPSATRSASACASGTSSRRSRTGFRSCSRPAYAIADSDSKPRVLRHLKSLASDRAAVEQRRLADAGLAHQQERPRLARSRVVQMAPDDVQFVLTPDDPHLRLGGSPRREGGRPGGSVAGSEVTWRWSRCGHRQRS